VLSVADNQIVITGRTGAGRILSSPTKRQGFVYLVSIGSLEEPPPAGFRNVQRRLRLLFEDELTQQLGGASREHVEALVDFGREVDFSKGRLLVHCQAGISRSSAAAVIILATTLGAGEAMHIAAHLRRLYPQCRPNRLMLQLADDVLSTGGVLQQAWAGGA